MKAFALLFSCTQWMCVFLRRVQLGLMAIKLIHVPSGYSFCEDKSDMIVFYTWWVRVL